MVTMADISAIGYDLYKRDWIERHTTKAERKASLKEYCDYVDDCIIEGDSIDTYEDWLFEVGFGGSIYACYSEFCDSEFLDKREMQSLLGQELYEVYLTKSDKMNLEHSCAECKHRLWNEEFKEWECMYSNFPNREECNEIYEEMEKEEGLC